MLSVKFLLALAPTDARFLFALADEDLDAFVDWAVHEGDFWRENAKYKA